MAQPSESPVPFGPPRRPPPLRPPPRRCARPLAGSPAALPPLAFAPPAGPNSAPSTYQIQLLEVVAGSDPTTYAASGKSEGYYQIIPIDSRPTWLMALVGVFCTVGPITLAGFFTYEKIYKKD